MAKLNFKTVIEELKRLRQPGTTLYHIDLLETWEKEVRKKLEDTQNYKDNKLQKITDSGLYLEVLNSVDDQIELLKWILGD
jgi:hypothetical protein